MQYIAYSICNLTDLNTPRHLRIGFHVKDNRSTRWSISVCRPPPQIAKTHKRVRHILQWLVIYTGAHKRRYIAIRNSIAKLPPKRALIVRRIALWLLQ